MKYFLVLIVFLMSFNSFSQTTPLCFSEPKLQNGGIGPQRLATGDLNNDGFPDIITANYWSDSISVLINSGDGISFSRVSYLVGNYPSDVVAKDLNGDGNLDIAVATATFLPNTIQSLAYILIGSPTGTFSAATTYTVSGGSTTMGTGDFNNDGIIDLVVGGYVNTSFLNGYGDGTFSQSYNKPSVLLPYDMVINDFNGDGVLDFAYIENGTSSLAGSHITIYKPGFGFPFSMHIGGDNYSITSGDFNNDGNIDLATCGLEFVIVTFGVGNGQFGSIITYTLPTAQECHRILSLDIDNDANLDLIVSAVDSMYIFYGASSGIFNISPITFSTEGDSYDMAAADFNVDGKIDFALVHPYTDKLSILLNRVKPNVTIGASSNSICIGSGVTLQANGAHTYSWNTGDTTAVNYQMPNVDVNYSVIGTGINYCVNTQTINVFVDNTCADVWPGDANSDGRVDNVDILELGLHYTQTGPPRASTSNAWQSYFANNWTGTISNGKNLNHSDCNGDGMINDNDTLAIYNNYGLTHAFKSAQTSTVNPQLSIVPDQTSVVKGTWGTASIYLGDAATNINNINGAAFTVDFDNTLIEANSIYIEYQNSFLDAGQNLLFRKLDFANGKIFTATTHTINNNVSGNGLIAKLHYQIKSSLTTDEVLNIALSQANQSNASGIIAPLTTGAGTLMALGSSVGLQELNRNIISISPNPTNGSLTINSKTDLQKIEVVSITGQLLLSEVPTNSSHTLHLDNFANGIYFVNLYQNNRIVKREKVVLNK
jgi:hypothetical protein